VLGIPTYTKNRATVLEVNGVKHILPHGGHLSLVKGGDGNWQTTDAQINYGYKINRKKYADVKANYKEFTQFFKAFLSVQKMQNIPTSQYDRAEYMVVKLIPSVMIETAPPYSVTIPGGVASEGTSGAIVSAPCGAAIEMEPPELVLIFLARVKMSPCNALFENAFLTADKPGS
jgi:hypothetical protein